MNERTLSARTLNDRVCAAIFDRYRRGTADTNDLARLFCVSEAAVWNAVFGRMSQQAHPAGVPGKRAQPATAEQT